MGSGSEAGCNVVLPFVSQTNTESRFGSGLAAAVLASTPWWAGSCSWLCVFKLWRVREDITSNPPIPN